MVSPEPEDDDLRAGEGLGGTKSKGSPRVCAVDSGIGSDCTLASSVKDASEEVFERFCDKLDVGRDVVGDEEVRLLSEEIAEAALPAKGSAGRIVALVATLAVRVLSSTEPSRRVESMPFVVLAGFARRSAKPH